MQIHSSGKGTKISVTLPLPKLEIAPPEETFEEQTSHPAA